jgi:hypothetical protein
LVAIRKIIRLLFRKQSHLSAGKLFLATNFYRGNCTFRSKVLLAQAANAAAILIYNQGDDPSRTGLFQGSLGGNSSIPG